MDKQHFLNKILLPFLILPILFVKPIHAQHAGVLESRDVILLFDEPLKPAAEEAVKLYPAIREGLEKSLRWKVTFRPAVMLIQDSNTFQKMTGSNLVVAFAVPKRDLIVIDYSKMKTDPFTLEMTMKHELCHLLLHKNIERDYLPRWLDEGVAQWVSGGLVDIIMDRYSALDGAILSNRYISIKALAKGFPRDGKNLILAYAESKSLVDYIIREYGPDGILEFLGHLKNREDIDSATWKSYSISFDELERRWYNGLKRRATWFTFVTNNLYEIIFFLGALLLIYGFIRALIRKRSYEEYEDEDME